MHRAEPSARPGPATESGVQSKNCLVTSQFLRNTGLHFHWHSSQLPDSGWIWWPVPHVVLKTPLMWSYTAQLLFMPCLRDNNSTSTKSACRWLDSLMWLQNEALVWHVRYLAHGERIQNQLCRRPAKICCTSPSAKASACISAITHTLQVCSRSPHLHYNCFKLRNTYIWDSFTTV